MFNSAANLRSRDRTKGKAVARGSPDRTTARPRARPNRDEKTASLREVVEALTALGFYLSAAILLLEKHPGLEAEGRMGEALRKSLVQHERATEVVRRLRDIDGRESVSSGPVGFA